MRPLVILLTFGLALAGCAATGRDKLAVCDGKHRRPANVHGSVLTPTPEAPPPAAQAPKPNILSAIQPAAFASCRA